MLDMVEVFGSNRIYNYCKFKSVKNTYLNDYSRKYKTPKIHDFVISKSYTIDSHLETVK